MQKSFSEIRSLAPDELSSFIDQINEPLLITNQGQPQFVAQSLAAFEAMVRRLRILERLHTDCRSAMGAIVPENSERGKVIPFRK